MIDPNELFADGIPDPPEEELEMAIEDLTGKDTPGAPEQRIEALKKRIDYLFNQLHELALREPTEGGQSLNDAASKVAFDLREARQQLARYQALNQGRN